MRPIDHEQRLLRLARFASGMDEVLLAYGRSDRLFGEPANPRHAALVERARAEALALPDGTMHVLAPRENGWFGLVDARTLRRPILLMRSDLPRRVDESVLTVAETVFDSLADLGGTGGNPRTQREPALAGAEGVAGIGVWRVGLADRLLVWSDETYRIYGLAPGSRQPSFDEALAYFPKDVQGTVRQHIRRAVEERTGFSFVLPFVRRDGQQRMIRCIGYVSADEDGVDQLYGIMQDVTEEREEQLKLWSAANHDALTGLPNRSLWQDRLAQAFAAAQKSGGSVGLVLCDLDQFKTINDVYGHEAGDEALRAVAKRLTSHCRVGDTLARLGGDEFAIIFSDLMSPDDVARVLPRLAANAEVPFEYRGNTITAKLSYGAAVFPRDAESEQELYRNADLALFRTKAEPQRRSTIYDPRLLVEHEGRERRARELRAAIYGDAIQPFYEPVVEIASGAIVAIEASACWREGDRFTPLASIPALAADKELAPLIGLAMIERIGRDLARMKMALGRVPPLILPVTARQLEDERFVAALADLMADKLVAASELTLEVDGDPLAALSRSGRVTFLDLVKAGVAIGYGSFVAGVSGLIDPGPLKVRHIKVALDQISGPTAAHAEPLLRGILETCRAKKVMMIASGVGDAEAAARVRGLGIAHAEGLNWCEPLPAEQLIPALGPAKAA